MNDFRLTGRRIDIGSGLHLTRLSNMRAQFMEDMARFVRVPRRFASGGKAVEWLTDAAASMNAWFVNISPLDPQERKSVFRFTVIFAAVNDDGRKLTIQLNVLDGGYRVTRAD